MTPATITIVLLCALLLIGVTTPFANPLFRRPNTSSENKETVNGPSISVLIVARGHHLALDEHLPVFLTQEYPPGYEIVVVADKSDDDTGNVLKRYSGHDKLYSTFIPDTSRYMSKNKLGVTLGVKAAKNDWIIMVDPVCKPESSHWLSAIAAGCRSGNNMVLGYTHFDDEAPRIMGFEHLCEACYLLHSAQHGHPYRTNCNVLGFRRKEFLEGYGFQGNLKYTIGEYDFLVNKFGRKDGTVVVCDKDAWLTEDTPSQRSWQNRKVYYQEVRKHLDNGQRTQSTSVFDTLCLHLTYLIELAGIVWGALTSNWIVLASAVVALLATLTLRTMIGLKCCRALGSPISWYQVVPYEISLIYRKFMTMIRYEYADKSDFISQKV